LGREVMYGLEKAREMATKATTLASIEVGGFPGDTVDPRSPEGVLRTFIERHRLFDQFVE
jgi:hypothetical protein